MIVRHSRPALRQLDSIYAYIAADSPRSARKVIANIRGRIQILGRLPFLGKSTDIPNVKRLVLAKYGHIVIYRIEKKAVMILQVLHSKQIKD